MSTTVGGTSGVTVPGTGSVVINGSGSGAITVIAPSVAGTNTLTLPALTDTVAVQSQAVRQIVNTINGTMATGTTIIPLDNTIPQNTEGDQYMSLAITPKSGSSKLFIQVKFIGAHSAAPDSLMVALFQDSIANALAVGVTSPPGNGYFVQVSLDYLMNSPGTGTYTFKVRAGSQVAGTTTFNGSAGTAYMGGALASSITITEIGG